MDSENIRSDENVLRPSVKRWLPGWIANFRRASSTASSNVLYSELPGSGNVHVLPVLDASIDPSTSERIAELNIQSAVLLGDCTEWSERCQSIETNLDRARQQMELAESRLSMMAEPIPEPLAEGLSPLQESYQNFAMTVALQESKLTQAGQRVSVLQEQRACIVAEALALSCDPRSAEPQSGELQDQSKRDSRNAA